MADKEQSNDTTKILSYVLVALMAFAGGYLVRHLAPQGGSKGTSDSGAAVPTSADKGGGGQAYDSDKIPIGDSPTKGPKDALVTIVEFSDFQCPFCSKAFESIQKVEKNYGDKVRMVFKHYPLPFHKQAKPAARVAMAAGEQGKFWEMHDKLFNNQKKFKGGGVEDLGAKWAKEMGLDVEKFEKDLKNNKSQYNKTIDQEMQQGKKLGVKGTPHFLINGKAISGAQPYSKFKSIIESELDAAQKSLKGGAKRSNIYQKRVAENFQKPSNDKAKKKKKPSKKKTQVSYVPVEDNDPMGGATEDPLVTIVEFSEFQCPFCKKAFPSVKKLKKNYGDRVRFVYNHNPLPFHDQAKPAARAAYAAQQQGKFWEMHDLLFENQKKLKQGEELFMKLAGQIGLNKSKFKEDMSSSKADEIIKGDQDLARKVGAKGTPTFFINGVKVVGAQPYSKFKSVVETQIERAQKLKEEKGLSGEKLYKAVAELNKEKEGGSGSGNKPSPTKDKPAPKVDTSKLKIGKAPVEGPENAPVTIYEFSDFQCPYCSKAHQTIQKVLPDYEGKVKFVHKNYPLPFHKQAKPAARAALAAKEQGKFWTMYELLFKNQGNLKQDGLYEKLASKAGLNVEQFKQDMKQNKSEYNKLIKDQMSQGKKVGVKGTPAFFINGHRLVGAQPASKFRSVIDKALEESG
jgi:protein-disulfide isomerase